MAGNYCDTLNIYLMCDLPAHNFKQTKFTSKVKCNRHYKEEKKKVVMPRDGFRDWKRKQGDVVVVG